VVGVAALSGFDRKDGFWRTSWRARDLITDGAGQHWLIDDYYDPDPARATRTYCKRGAFCPGGFDPVEWGVPPSILLHDTNQLPRAFIGRTGAGRRVRRFNSRICRGSGERDPGAYLAQELLGSMVIRAAATGLGQGPREMGLAEDRSTTLRAHRRPLRRMAGELVPWNFGNVVAGRIANRLDLGGTTA